jgi:hypothetical protein
MGTPVPDEDMPTSIVPAEDLPEAAAPADAATDASEDSPLLRTGEAMMRTAGINPALPRMAAGLVAGVGSGIASAAAHLGSSVTNAMLLASDKGRAAIPENSALWEERAHRWARGVSDLADYVPATKETAEEASRALGLPVEVIKSGVSPVIKDVADRTIKPLVSDETYNTLGKAAKAGASAATDLGDMVGLPASAVMGGADKVIKPHVSENAYTTLGEVASDIGTDSQAVPAYHLGKAAGLRAIDAADAYRARKAAGPAPKATEGALTPDLGEAVSAASLRAQPNPIPAPEGTVHRAKAPGPNDVTTPPPGGTPIDVPPPPSERAGGTQGAAPTPNAAPEPSPAVAGKVTLPESDAAPQDMSLPPEQRALIREGVAARRAAALQSPGDAQRGSVQLFKAPKNEGPQETPDPATVPVRQGHLDALDKLSGGALATRRASALSGDYNATGDDWQLAKTGSKPMQEQLARENDALHTAMDNVHKSTGSLAKDSVDPATLEERGRAVRAAIHGIEDHFGKMTDDAYDAARAAHGNQPLPSFLPRVSEFLADEGNYMPEGFRRSAQARLNQLKTAGDNGVAGDGSDAAAPGSVGAAEKFREWLNKNRTLDNMHTVKQLVDHTDTDVTEHGGPGLFQAARNMRRHQYQMLEEPVGIRKLLAPSDSQGINHAIPEHKVMDYIADLPREQHEHVMNVLRAGAHLSPELAEQSAHAIREIQAHTVSRLHDAATNDGGKWNARDFYNATARYARNADSTFKDRPDILKHLQTINDAGNTLHLDKSYPGAAAQKERTGLGTKTLEVVGAGASGLAHELPMGRILGRAIESGTEKMTGKLSENARDKAAKSRLVDRTGKQRGSVQIMRGKEAADPMLDEFHDKFAQPASVGFAGKRVGSTNVDLAKDPFDPNRVHLEMLRADEMGKGHGSQALKQVTDLADKHGATVQLNATPVGKNGPSQAKLIDTYRKHGFELDPDAPGATSTTMTRAPKGEAQLNIGLHQGQEGKPGFRKMSKQEATGAVESTGAKVTKSSVLTPDAHGVAEPTLVASTDRPLSAPEMQDVLAKTKQSAIPQRTSAGDEMHVAPGHEEIAKREGWDKFNPDYFRNHDGSPASKSSQRGSVRVMNERPLAGAPEGDRPNGAARSAAAAYAKKAGIDYQPLKEYRYVDPKVAKDVADAYDKMEHNPSDPKVKKSYDAFKAETLAQYKQMEKAGVKVTLDPSYPYKNPREMHEDVRANNHMSVFPSEAGFGSKSTISGDDVVKHIQKNGLENEHSARELLGKDAKGRYQKVELPLDEVDADTPISTGKIERYAKRDTPFPAIVTDSSGKVVDGNHRVAAARMRGDKTISAYVPEQPHPLMEKAPVQMGGKDATYNDLFRAVHDYFGHAAEGNGFRANGEYNAWRAHRQMYSEAARGAMDAETLGQNSWVNSGPAGALNKGASGADTIYADQKAGLLPKSVVNAAVEGVGADEHHITNQLTPSERNQLRTDTTKRLIDAFHGAPATEEYAAAALGGAAKRGWYRNSAQAIVNQFGHEAPRFAGLLSAMSPQVSVQTNFANALKTYVNWDKAGRPQDPGEIRRIMEDSSQKGAASQAAGTSNVLDAWVNNAVRALTADDPTEIQLSGPKVHSFYKNLTDNVNEVTNDAWMSAFAKIDPAKLGGSLNKAGPGKSPSYLALSAKTRAAASMLSRLTGETWTPAEVQETVWSWAKTAYEHAEEKGDRSIPDLVKNGDITDELIRSTPDFHQLFGTPEHRGFLQSSRFARSTDELAGNKGEGATTAGAGKAREAAAAALRPHLISAAERLERLRQERKASGSGAPKEE